MDPVQLSGAEQPPSAPQDDQEKTDWIKITGIVLMILGAIVAVLAFFCLKGTFPLEMIGGKTGFALSCFSALCVITIGGAIFFVRRKKAMDASPAAPQ